MMIKTTPILVLMAIVSCSQPSKTEATADGALHAAIESLRQNMIEPNAETLDKLTFDQLSYGHSSGTIEDKKTFIETLTSGKSNFLDVTFENQTIGIEDNTAIVRFDLLADTHDAGKEPASIKLHVMTVWKKDGETWKLLARQAVKI